MDMKKVVLGRMESDWRVVEERRTDLGERPKMQMFDKPVTMVWLNAGSTSDVLKAQEYAAKQEPPYHVFTYPTNERDPLAAAKADLFKGLSTAKPRCVCCAKKTRRR